MTISAFDRQPIVVRFFAVKLLLSRLKFLENLATLHQQTKLVNEQADKIEILVAKCSAELKKNQQLISTLQAELDKIRQIRATLVASAHQRASQ
jgi:lipid II:glycine glycyltransferase (peptidoglycan interpeptide bridge formation enzyme)